MNTEEYIKSGVIEDYCLGLLKPYEMEEVAQNALHYKEIKAAIEAYETALKKYAEGWAVNDENKHKRNELPGDDSAATDN
jgi:hypothetical protein